MLRLLDGLAMRHGIRAFLIAAFVVAMSFLFGERYIDRGSFRIDLLRLLFTLPLGLLAGSVASQPLDRWTRARLGSVAASVVFFAFLGAGFLSSIDPPSQILTRTSAASLAVWSVIMGTALGLVLYSPDTPSPTSIDGTPRLLGADHPRDRAT